MDYLVRIAVDLPPDMDPAERAALLVRERARGRELVSLGVIRGIWRVPGGQRNVGIWRTDDPGALHDAIASLPCYPWLRSEVTPLAPHPVMEVP